LKLPDLSFFYPFHVYLLSHVFQISFLLSHIVPFLADFPLFNHVSQVCFVLLSFLTLFYFLAPVESSVTSFFLSIHRTSIFHPVIFSLSSTSNLFSILIYWFLPSFHHLVQLFHSYLTLAYDVSLFRCYFLCRLLCLNFCPRTHRLLFAVFILSF
jgi:hypothetical protein